MSLRTTSSAVQAVLNADYDTINNPDLTPYMTLASAIVDDVSNEDNMDQQVMSSTKLEIVERFLSAWAYCCYDQTYQSRNTSKAGGTFKGQAGMNINSNNYGQMALMADYSGYLRALSSKGLVRMMSLAVDYDTQENDASTLDPEGGITTDF